MGEFVAWSQTGQDHRSRSGRRTDSAERHQNRRKAKDKMQTFFSEPPQSGSVLSLLLED